LNVYIFSSVEYVKNLVIQWMRVYNNERSQVVLNSGDSILAVVKNNCLNGFYFFAILVYFVVLYKGFYLMCYSNIAVDLQLKRMN